MTETRTILELSGTETASFLQGLITNDIEKARDVLVYAALLTPQGKYLADFFITLRKDGSAILDVASSLAPALAQRLSMYKLRADVTIASSELRLSRGLGDPPPDAFADPRHPALGWRAYGEADAGDEIDWTAIRVAHCIPESGIELIPNDSYPLEVGLDRLSGVDFRKGCYVGQEVTARMKHKTTLRKGLATVAVEGEAPVGTPITRDGKPVGTLYSQADGCGIAYLRFDRAGPGMTAEGAAVDWRAP